MAGAREEDAERSDRIADKAEAASAGLLVQSLAKADRGFRMYLPNNPLHAKFFDEFRKRTEAHLEEYGSLRLGVTHESLLCRGEPIYTNPELRENLAFRMYADGVRSLTLDEEIEPSELRALVEIVGRSSPDADEDDIVTRLWSAELPHVTYTIAEMPPAGGVAIQPAPAPAAAQEGAIRRYAAAIAAAPPPALEPPLPQQVFNISEEELDALQSLLAAEEQRTPFEDMSFIVEAILSAEEDPATLGEFLEILAHLCGDLVLTGRADQAVALLSVGARAAASPGLPPGHAARIEGARGLVLTPAVLEGLTRLLALADGIDRTSLHALVVALGRHAVGPFTHLLGDVPGKETRKVLIEALAETGRESPELFLPFLLDSRWYLVRNTIYILRRIAGPESSRAILRCASHKDLRVRKEVLLYFEETGDPAGEPVLLGYLGDEVPSMRISATRSLARRGSRAAAERLLALTVSPGFPERGLDERETVWEAVGALAPDRALPALKDLLLKRRWFGQARELEDTACACAGLRRIGTPEAVAILREAAAGKRGEARELVEKALRAVARGRGAGASPALRDADGGA